MRGSYSGWGVISSTSSFHFWQNEIHFPTIARLSFFRSKNETNSVHDGLPRECELFEGGSYFSCQCQGNTVCALAVQGHQLFNKLKESPKPPREKSTCQKATRSLVAVEPRRPPTTNVGTETAFRLDQRKHFRKSKHLLRSEVN